MKKIIFFLLCALYSVPIAAEHFANLGIDFNYARFHLNKLASHSGYLAGPHFDYYFRQPCYVYGGAFFDALWNAGLICSTDGTRSEVNDYNVHGRIGYTFSDSCQIWDYIPYTGLGYYQIAFQFEPDVIRYKYRYLFIPVGFTVFYNSECDFTWQADLQYRAGFYSRVKITTPCIQACDDTLTLKYSHGVRLRMPFISHYTSDRCVQFTTTIAPYFDWNFFNDTCEKNSECVVFQVPELKRWYLGLNMNVGIQF